MYIRAYSCSAAGIEKEQIQMGIVLKTVFSSILFRKLLDAKQQSKSLIKTYLCPRNAVRTKAFFCRTRVPTPKGQLSFGARTRVVWRADSCSMAHGLTKDEAGVKQRRKTHPCPSPREGSAESDKRKRKKGTLTSQHLALSSTSYHLPLNPNLLLPTSNP